MYLLKNGYVVENNKLIQKDIYIKNNRITYEKLEKYEILDCSGCLIMPGACDMHVHLREPGQEVKETIKTGTLSAAKGGITTICAMPNLIPYPDCLANLEVELEAIKKDAVVNVLPYGCLTKGEKGNKLADYQEIVKYVKGFSDDGVGIDDLELFENAMQEIKKLNSMVVSHAEVGNLKFTREGEYLAVKRELDLVRKTNVKYHFCHISTSDSIDYIKKAKEEGLNVTFEITPHHIFLNKEDINNNPNFKMNPPLSDKSDMEYCLKAVVNGLCDVISTDHAPHTEEEKNQVYEKAPNGIIGLETMIPLIYTKLVKENLISLDRMLDLLVNNPRKILGLEQRNLYESEIADLAIIDINNYHIYQKDEILSKGKNSPFIGWNLTGFTKYTLVNGKLVYERK